MNRREINKGRQRIREIRDKRNRVSTAESIQNKKPVIVGNILIELITGIILLVGVYYLVQFILISENFAGKSMTRISLGAITVFAVGYLIYLGMKIRAGIQILRHSKNSGDVDIPS